MLSYQLLQSNMCELNDGLLIQIESGIVKSVGTFINGTLEIEDDSPNIPIASLPEIVELMEKFDNGGVFECEIKQVDENLEVHVWESGEEPNVDTSLVGYKENNTLNFVSWEKASYGFYRGELEAIVREWRRLRREERGKREGRVVGHPTIPGLLVVEQAEPEPTAKPQPKPKAFRWC